MQLSDERRTVNAFELQVAIMFFLIWIIILIILIINMILANVMIMIMTMPLFAGATGDLPTQ